MSVFKDFDGSFWIAGDDSVKQPGTLSVGPRKKPEVEVEGELTPSLTVTGTREREDGTKVVVSVLSENETLTGPVLIHGLDKEDTPITLLDGVTSFRAFNPLIDENPRTHRLGGNQAVIGGHLSSRDHQFSGARVQLQDLDKWGSLIANAAWGTEIALNDGGTIVFEEASSLGVCITASALKSRSLRDLDRTIVRPLMSLLNISTSYPHELLALQVQDLNSGEWWDVYTASQFPDGGNDNSDVPRWLLQPSDLKLEHIKIWLDQVDRFGPLPPVIADLVKPREISIETQVSQLTTIAEGLHRALFPGLRRMDDEKADEVLNVVLEAVRATYPAATDAVKGLLGNLTDLSYGTRLKQLANETRVAVPGVTGIHRNKWIDMVYDARIDFAHRLRSDFFEDEDINNYLTTAMSLQWLLVGLLLVNSGFSELLLAARFEGHEQYQIFLKYAQLWKPSVYGPLPGR
jgi:ApeA N-terminal domain 1